MVAPAVARRVVDVHQGERHGLDRVAEGEGDRLPEPFAKLELSAFIANRRLLPGMFPACTLRIWVFSVVTVVLTMFVIASEIVVFPMIVFVK